MILYSFWSSWPDLSFETYFVFFRFFQQSLQKYFRGARIVNCFFRSGPDRQFFCFRGARIANFYFRGARIANFFALFVSRVSKILVFRFVSFVSFVSFRLFRIESLDFFCVNFLYIARTVRPQLFIDTSSAIHFEQFRILSVEKFFVAWLSYLQ